MMDANQVWGVDEAIAAMRGLAALRPVVDRGADEPRRRARPRAHPRARSRPIRVATGEHVQNRVIFKQLFQAEAIDVCQLDACRVGGVNEAIAILLLAAKFGVPVCPHAGGVGLCEYVQHLAVFDYIARQRLARGPGRRVGRPPARALPRPGGRQRRPLPCAAGAGLQHRDAARRRSTSTSSRTGPAGPRRLEGRGGRRMTVTHGGAARTSRSAVRPVVDRYRLLQAALRRLRAGPALILLLLVVVVSLTTPVFLTSRNIGNVFSQTSVIAVARARPAARDRHARHRPLGRLDDRALGRRRRDRLRAHALDASLVIARDPRHRARRRRSCNGLVYVYGRVPHPFIVTLATLSIVRGHRALGVRRDARSRACRRSSQTLGGGSIDWLPYSIFVVAGARASRAVVLTTRLVWGRWLYAVGGNPEAARRAGHSRRAACSSRSTCSAGSPPASAGCSPPA